MKVLVIGSRGMLGQELVREFGESGHEVISWDKEEIDITKKDLVLGKIKSAKPDIIINAAAYNAVDKIEEEDRDLALAVNGYAVGNISEAARAVGGVLVHYSTDYVFEGNKVNGYKEDDEPNPQSIYANSKLIGEKQVGDGKNYLIRTSRLFGKSATSVGAKKSFVDAMICLARECESIELVDEELSSPTYVRDLAERTREIIEERKPFGVYHITNSGACTWYGWAKKIFELAGENIKLIPVGSERFPRSAKRPKYSVLLSTKIKPMRNWEEALGDYLKNNKD